MIPSAIIFTRKEVKKGSRLNRQSDEYITKWYGPGRKAHYGAIIEEGRKRATHALKDLIKLAGDPLYPVIVRSTALSLLTAYPGEETSGHQNR